MTVGFSCADMMLGKEKMAKLRSKAKLHNLAAGSQTIPNSVAEIAAAQGKNLRRLAHLLPPLFLPLSEINSYPKGLRGRPPR